jgi:RHS repeat-associated protein
LSRPRLFPFRAQSAPRLISAIHAAGAVALVALVSFPFAPDPIRDVAGPSAAKAGAGARKELTRLRSANSKTYLNPNGSRTTVVSSEPMHFRDAAGRWRAIDTRLVASRAQGFAFENSANDFRAFFKRRLDEDYLRIDVDGRPFRLDLVGAGRPSARRAGGGLLYEDAFPGVDLRYELVPDGVKETLELASAEVPTTYRFLLTPPDGVRAEPERQRDGSWAIYAGAAGGPTLVLAAPFAIEGPAGSPTERFGPVKSTALDVRRAGRSLAIELRIDRRWLRDPARRFPVLVDPTITVQPTTQYGNFNFNCSTCTPKVDTLVRIGTSATEIWRPALKFGIGSIPTGVTITDAKMKLFYTGNCVQVDNNDCPKSDHQLDLHRMTQAWTTSTTTAELTGKYDETPTSTLNFSTIADADVQWLTWNVTSLVQAWHSGNSPNHGVLLRRNPDPLRAGGPVALSGRFDIEPSVEPKLEVTYVGDAVELLPITSTHSNGADLEWTRYVGETGAPFQKYEVHRWPTPGFNPSAATRIAQIGDINTTSYRDTTAAADKPFSYRIVANSSASNERTVRLNLDGHATMTLQPRLGQGKATYITVLSNGTTCWNHGSDDDLWLSAETTAKRRALVWFDLRKIPADATIEAGRLSLWRPYSVTFSPSAVDAHRVTSAWKEGAADDDCGEEGATWAAAEAGVDWATPGADYDPLVSASRSLGSYTAPRWDDYHIGPLVQQWISGQAPNHGVLFKLRDETPTDGRRVRFYSDDFAVAPTLAPKLYVDYLDGSHAIAPTVAIASPAANELVAGSAVPITAAASDDGRVAKVEFLVDGALVATDSSAPFETNWNSTTATNAVHTLTARAIDDAGNATPSPGVPVIVENSALPSTSVTAPANGATVSGTVTVTANAAGGRPISRVEFLVDGLRFAEDAAAPFSAYWNTLDTTQPAYDGVHVLTTKAYDLVGREATSASVNVTVGNTAGTKYDGGYGSTEPPRTMGYDPSTETQAKHGIDVTVTNESGIAWPAETTKLRYRWHSPDESAPVDGGEIGLGGDIGPGQPRTIPVLVEPPPLPLGVNRAQYQLEIDLFDQSTGSWFADKGNKPLEQPVIVNKTLLRNALGLERYYHYTGEELGAGMQHLVNVANGNSIVRWTPFLARGRGLSTVVDLTYNALEKKCECPAGNNWSLAISGLTRFGNPIDIHPNKADEIARNLNKYIEFTDGDGTTHTFTSADGITYQEPAGVHLFLRRYSTADPQRKWALTRPDRVTFFYNDEGYPTFVRDRNGNELAFTLELTPSGEDPGGPKKRITKVRDAGGREFAIAYYTKAEAKKAHVRGKIKSITDHSGSLLKFDYYEDGNLLRLTQVGGTSVDGVIVPSRSFVFTYTTSSGNGPAISDKDARANPEPRTSNQSTRLYSVRDPRGKETLFTYLASGDGEDRWRIGSRTDRAGAETTFAYDTDTRLTTITAPLARVSKYAYDSEGKVTTIANPKNQVTAVTWTGDRQVDTVTEPGGGFTDYDYNDNGYLTAETTLRDKRDPSKPEDDLFARTELKYQNIAVINDGGTSTDVDANWKPGRGIAHISQLIEKTEPKGFAAESTRPDDFQWNFTYDTRGNLLKVIEPGPEPLAQRPTTVHAYDAGNGDLTSTTDPNGNVTKFLNYDANGFPTRIEDAETNVTRFGYDADGQLLWLQDARHTNSTGREDKTDKTHFYYDEFHRLTRQSAPKSTELAPGLLIWTGADYDPNDNLTVQYSPKYGGLGWVEEGPKTTSDYDAMDRQTAVAIPHDPENDDPVKAAARRTELAYDDAGRLTRLIRPLGVKTTAVTNDYVTEFAYDTLDRPLKETRYPKDGGAAGARITHYCYDLAGDLRSMTAPKNATAPLADRFTVCPAELAPENYTPTTAGFTTKLAYLADHLLKSETNPLANTQAVEYDLNGNVTKTTDAADNVETRIYNERDLLTKTEETLYDSRAKGPLKTILEYDKAGNLIREASPRAVDTIGGNGPFENGPYVTGYRYDKINRPILVKLPTDASTRQAWVHNFYDPVGNLTSTSLPVETDNPTLVANPVNKERRTDISYFDTGWIHTTDDPGKSLVAFDHTAEGWQKLRRGTTRDEDGKVIDAPEEEWTYYADGLLRTEKDPNGDPQEFTYNENDNLVLTEDANGVDRESEAPITVELDYNGFDEVTEIRQRKDPTKPWQTTNYAYDLNGNVEQRIDPKLKPDQTDERRTNNFSYDAGDRLATHVDLGGPSCGDEQKIETNYLRNNWVSLERITKSTAACEAESDWKLRQQTGYDYFRNGLVKQQTTWQGGQAPGNVVEAHTLGYESGGIYLNGHQTVDSFSLKGPTDTPGGAAECRDFDENADQRCKNSYSYDGRDRLTSWSLRRKNTPSGERGETLTAIDYTLDENTDDATRIDALAGDVVREVTSGLWTSPTRTFSYYPSGRLKSVTAGSTTDYYAHWQSLGSTITCVTADPQPETPTPTETCKDGSSQAGLRDWTKFDTLDRLKTFKSYRTDATLDSSYTYDAFDRVSRQSENPNGAGTRLTEFGYLGLTGAVVSETQSGTAAMNRSYTYDAFDQRVGISVTEGGTTKDYTYARNVHGDISLLLNDAGSATAAYGYKPYGALDTDANNNSVGLSRGDPSTINPRNPYRFNDRRFDPGSGSIEMGARRFGPDAGRFLQQDFYRDALDDLELSSDPLTQNRYSFAGGNPISFVEIDGHRPEPMSTRTSLAELRARYLSLGCSTHATSTRQSRPIDPSHIPVCARLHRTIAGLMSAQTGGGGGWLSSLLYFVPGIGEIKAAADCFNNPTALNCATAIPLGGKVVRAGRIGADKIADAVRAKRTTALVPKSSHGLGVWGEARLGQVLGFRGYKPRRPFKTSDGPRYTDRLVGGVAHEAKAGLNVRLTSRIRRQILKDVELIETGQIRGAHWHFFRGADPDLLRFLARHGIRYTVHP